ncbi:MAG: hypothetical protein Q7S87_14895 [Agitococcus sp.]|nr:hypothetical protein [Agitococcus sp.]
MLKKSLMATLLSAASTITVASDIDISTLQAQLKAQQIQIDALVAASEKPTLSTISSQTTIGGYGEAHYYNYENAAQQYDAYRFVLYIGHKFSNTVRLHSELEIEHGLVRDNPTGATNLGELELEQMFIEWNYHGKQNISFGQILVPIGFLNETHEPETFYGAKRNPVETAIIPTTWWEGGIKASGLVAGVDGLSYNAVVTTGLKTDNANIRSGRQKGAKAVAEDMAYTFGFNYQGIAGLTTGVTYQLQKDISQAIGQTNEATLIEAHIGYTWQNFSTRALYAKWDIDGIATTASYAAKAEQEGYYVEAAYKPIEKLGVFARYSAWDNDAADVADSKKEQWNYGVNYYIAPRVVLKLDIQDQVLPTPGLDEDGFALAVGYSF